LIKAQAKLHIGTDIPEELVTKVVAILAKRGSGKTYLAGRYKEEFVKAGIPTVTIDPMSAHWGIRTKYAIIIFGGPKSDIDIEPTDGALIGEVIVKENLTCLIDLGDMKKDDQRQFAADLWTTMYYYNKTPRHLIVEEADIFAPQRNKSDQAKLSTIALDTVVRRGRQKGLGVTLITQRPAVITKDVISQADVFFFMHMVDSNDIKVINEIMSNAGVSKEEKKGLLAKIINFKPGEALLFSPTWMNTIKSFKVSKKESYHAGRTPMLGEDELPDPTLLPVFKDDVIKALNDLTNGTTEEGGTSSTSNTCDQKTTFYLGLGLAMLFFTMMVLFL